MRHELAIEVEEAAAAEGVSMARLISDVLGLVLLTPTGKKLVTQARENNRTIREELQLALDALDAPSEEILQIAAESHRSPMEMLSYLLEELSIETIRQLAKNSQRTPIEMVAHLTRLGLRVYQRTLERMDAAIEETLNRPED